MTNKCHTVSFKCNYLVAWCIYFRSKNHQGADCMNWEKIKTTWYFGRFQFEVKLTRNGAMIFSGNGNTWFKKKSNYIVYSFLILINDQTTQFNRHDRNRFRFICLSLLVTHFATQLTMVDVDIKRQIVLCLPLLRLFCCFWAENCVKEMYTKVRPSTQHK